jgi:hypothetical protein
MAQRTLVVPLFALRISPVASANLNALVSRHLLGSPDGYTALVDGPWERVPLTFTKSVPASTWPLCQRSSASSK